MKVALLLLLLLRRADPGSVSFRGRMREVVAVDRLTGSVRLKPTFCLPK
jgi:hypothetical protein